LGPPLGPPLGTPLVPPLGTPLGTPLGPTVDQLQNSAIELFNAMVKPITPEVRRG
jgi:hypothetical protein